MTTPRTALAGQGLVLIRDGGRHGIITTENDATVLPSCFLFDPTAVDITHSEFADRIRGASCG